MPISAHDELTPTDLQKCVKEFMAPVNTYIYEHQTIEQASSDLRQRIINHRITYLYVINEEGVLKGLVSARHLLFGKPDVKIADIMIKDIISVHEDRVLSEILGIFSRYRLLALPVIDDKGCLLGLVELHSHPHKEEDNYIDPKTRNATFQLIGLSNERARMRTFWHEYRYRMPWLLCNMFGGLICAMIVAYNNKVIEGFIIVAMFIPLILTINESISMQSMTLSSSFLSRRGIPWKRFILRIIRDFQVSIMIGLTSGFIMGITYYLLPSFQHLFIVVIFESILITMIISALLGTLIPAVIHKFKMDPKVAAGPVVLMFVDIVSTALYLFIASYMLLGKS